MKKTRARKELSPFWERRYQALSGRSVPIDPPTSSEGWAEELITAELLGEDLSVFQFIHPLLGIYTGPGTEEKQEGFEPKPTLLEWWVDPSSRSRPHPLQIELAALPDRKEASSTGEIDRFALSFSDAASGEVEKHLVRWMWEGENMTHSLSIPGFRGQQHVEKTEKGVQILFDLPDEFDVSQNDLIEAAAYCNISPETKLFVAGKKASIFKLGDPIEIRTSKLSLQMQFDLIAGDGEFCGQISRSNRPLQTACRGEDLYSAFDWKISLRTLRRSPDTKLSFFISCI